MIGPKEAVAGDEGNETGVETNHGSLWFCEVSWMVNGLAAVTAAAGNIRRNVPSACVGGALLTCVPPRNARATNVDVGALAIADSSVPLTTRSLSGRFTDRPPASSTENERGGLT